MKTIMIKAITTTNTKTTTITITVLKISQGKITTLLSLSSSY